MPESYKKEAARELGREEIFSILNQLQDLGCFYLGFTGGEPFLREDIFDVLWHAKKKGFQLIIYTNGSLIDDAKTDELKRLNPNKVDITIPAMSEIAFERISQVTGSRDKVFKAIELLHKKGIKLGFKTCLLKENEGQIKDIKDFAVSLDAFHRLDDTLSPRLDGDREPYAHRGTMSVEISNQLKITDNEQPATGDGLALRLAGGGSSQMPHAVRCSPHAETLFKCGVGRSQIAINPYGELKMCLLIDYPKYKVLNNRDTRRQNLKEAWERLRELVASIKPDKNYQCDKCQFHNYCKWCPAKAWLYNKSFTGCESQSRLRAERIWLKDKVCPVVGALS